jgi:hypothetical protein
MTVVSDGVMTVEAFVALTGLNESEYDPAAFIITSTSTNAGGISTRIIEPDYIHVDTTVVFKPEEEVRPDYIPDSSIKIIDQYDQDIQLAADQAAQAIQREQSQSKTTQSIIIASVVVVSLILTAIVVKIVWNYKQLHQIDMHAMERIKTKQHAKDISELQNMHMDGSETKMKDGDTLDYTTEGKMAAEY